MFLRSAPVFDFLSETFAQSGDSKGVQLMNSVFSISDAGTLKMAESDHDSRRGAGSNKENSHE